MAPCSPRFPRSAAQRGAVTNLPAHLPALRAPANRATRPQPPTHPSFVHKTMCMPSFLLNLSTRCCTAAHLATRYPRVPAIPCSRTTTRCSDSPAIPTRSLFPAPAARRRSTTRLWPAASPLPASAHDGGHRSCSLSQESRPPARNQSIPRSGQQTARTYGVSIPKVPFGSVPHILRSSPWATQPCQAAHAQAPWLNAFVRATSTRRTRIPHPATKKCLNLHGPQSRRTGLTRSVFGPVMVSF